MIIVNSDCLFVILVVFCFGFKDKIIMLIISIYIYLYVNGSGSITSVGEERAKLNVSAVVYL